METLPTNPMTMPGMPLTGFSQSYGAKTSRGSRLGRSIPMSAGTEYYGYPGGGGGGGATINFSPTISNIDAPLIESLDTGSTTKVTTGRPRRTGGGGGGGAATGGGRTPTGGGGGGGGGRPARETAVEAAQTRLSRGENRAALQGLAESGGRITRSELKEQLASGAGLRQTRNLIESGELSIGGKASAFLDKQLAAKGARTLGTTAPQESGGGGGGGGGGQATTRGSATLEPFNRLMGSLTRQPSNKEIAQAAASSKASPGKLSKAEIKTATQGGLKAQNILNQIQKGNITATKKATAKLKSQARRG